MEGSTGPGRPWEIDDGHHTYMGSPTASIQPRCPSPKAARGSAGHPLNQYRLAASSTAMSSLARSPEQAFELAQRRGAGDGCGDAGAGHQPGQGDLGRFRPMPGGHIVQHLEDAEAALVEVGLDPATSRALAQVGLAAVLAAEEALREAVIGDDAQALGHGEIAQRAIVIFTIVEVVLGLQHLVARQALGLGGIQGRAQLDRIEVRGPDGPHFARRDQLLVGRQGLLMRRVRVELVRQVQIDVVRLQPAQRVLHGALDPGRRQPLPVRCHLHADLCDDHHPVTAAAGPHPFAEDGFRLAANVARLPGRVHVRRIHRLEAGPGQAVQEIERGLLVDGPSEHIAAEHQR